MLLCLAPSPDDKRIYAVDHLRTGEVLRASAVYRHASGKGVNAARAAAAWGADVTLVTFAGSEFETRLKDGLKQLPMTVAAVVTGSATRCCTTIISGSAGSATELVEEALPVQEAELEEFVRVANDAFSGAGAVLLAGSLPPGFPVEVSSALVETAVTRDIPVIVDAHGQHLLRLLPSRPYLVRINRDELLAAAGEAAGAVSGVYAAVQILRERGARHIVVSDGPEDVLLFEECDTRPATLSLHAVEAVNCVGSGDAMAGGIGAVLSAGGTLAEAVLAGAALGMANAQTLLPGAVEAETVSACLHSLRWA